jgi:hypothetical protein
MAIQKIPLDAFCKAVAEIGLEGIDVLVPRWTEGGMVTIATSLVAAFDNLGRQEYSHIITTKASLPPYGNGMLEPAIRSRAVAKINAPEGSTF